MNHAINCEISEKLSDNCTCGVDMAVPVAQVPPSVGDGRTRCISHGLDAIDYDCYRCEYAAKSNHKWFGDYNRFDDIPDGIARMTKMNKQSKWDTHYRRWLGLLLLLSAIALLVATAITSWN